MPARVVATRAGGTVAVSNARSAATVSHRTWHAGTPTAPVHYRPTSPANPVPRDGRFVADNSFPVPGLGFDYPHFFATHPNFGRNHRTNGFILPFFGGGIYVPYPYYAEPPTYEEQAAANEVEAAAQQNSGEPAAGERNVAEPETGALRAASSYGPQQAQPEYVFVRRDGTVFFAVAFTWAGDKLQYVTTEGLRRSVTLDMLDLHATQQFNDQRGIAIRLPA
jgi:hypothetical protein